VAEVFGLGVEDLPEGWTAVRVVMAVECFVPAEEDSRKLCIRTNDGTTIWDVMGLGRAIMIEGDRYWVTTGGPDDGQGAD
jgi:hypothetical protein